ncbi:RNA polymerase sigma factor [Streptomyces ruber]|uniref:RNA polymerase sigma factor n=2 Tax=Streptomyces TaxID=1883 RepID=A0A918B878_9ACTN|nr:RNA polymerase sigma factor SigF [Streptomyces ruber]GGQ42107.1 RNA polymerase sigma factor [Streptomyces ruber]
MRDEERGTRELPAENGGRTYDGAGGPGPDGPGGPRHWADGVDGIPEQARPHPEDESPAAAAAARWTGPVDDAERETLPDGRRSPEGAAGSTTPSEGRRRVTAGGTMSEHERNAEQRVQGTQHDPQDRSGARAMFVRLRGLSQGSAEYAELRNQLVRMHLPLVEHLARRFRNRGEPLDDLTQVATIGLIKSVDRFDPDRGVEFSTYATPTVVGEIKRHFRDKGWAVRVPRRLQELRLALTTATAELSQQHGRSPTVHELAEKLAISEEEVLEGLESANAYSTLSLDVPDTDDESPAVADTLGAEDEALEGVEYRESLKPLLEDLPPREKRILLLRFFGNMTQSQIAQEVGISQMHVSRLLARTLAQLREKLLVEE